MIYHILPGDSLVQEFSKTGIEGEVIVCREAFIVGPLDGDAPEEFWNVRANFILGEYGEDEIQYHENVADELEKLNSVRSGDEVDLWFEYELFCQVNMWFCLSQLAGSGAEINRVAPMVISKDDRWKGFGGLNFEDLKICFEGRLQLTADDILLGTELWQKYRLRDAAGLLARAGTRSPVFPYLEETAEAAAQIETGPMSVLRQIRSEGLMDPDVIFVEFSKRAGVYGLGDLQVFEMLERL
jgi:hypothetical protein